MFRFPSALVLLLFAAASSAAEPPRGEVLLPPCFGCHGTGGINPGAVPDLSGTRGANLVDEMLAFKSGEQEGTVMNRIARGYTEEEIRAMGDYFEGMRRGAR